MATSSTRDTAVIILRETEDGFVEEYFLYNRSPLPGPSGLINALIGFLDEDNGDDYQIRISSDKPDLKTEFGQFVDNFFAK